MTHDPATFAAYNAGVKAAREEYAAHHITACYVSNCADAMRLGSIWCRAHNRERLVAQARMAAVRAAKGEPA